MSQILLRLSDLSEPEPEPEPDLMLLPFQADLYRQYKVIGPQQVLLVLLAVELSDSTPADDVRIKAPLHARAGVSALWVFDLQGRRLHSFCAPRGGLWTSARRGMSWSDCGAGARRDPGRFDGRGLTNTTRAFCAAPASSGFFPCCGASPTPAARIARLPTPPPIAMHEKPHAACPMRRPCHRHWRAGVSAVVKSTMKGVSCSKSSCCW